MEASSRPPPHSSALNLTIRFVLELAIWGGFAYWGWHLADGGWAGAILAALLFVVAAAIWGIFKVPGDPRPEPFVTISGPLRLAIEAVLIGVSVYGIWSGGSRAAAETLLTACVVHDAVTWERIVWLLRH